ncbi:MAG: hypothetical protein HY929_01035 [Euryarchaeota archaeon]|nr:hypothetical protein [Euryarchaeota archaeon]
MDTYEYIEGFPLRNVKAFECPKCREFIFTPEQVEEIEKRTEQLKAHIFAFERKITISGRSLVINIPEDLAHHLNIVKGKKVKLIPLDNRRFLVEAIEK